jgi:hypothetical protein
MNAAERNARKQVLLTRIAFSRGELRRDVAQVKRALELPHLLRALLGDSLGGTLGRTLFGTSSPGAQRPDDLLGTALGWLRRYRVAASLLGGVMPLLRGGGRWRRLLRVAVIGAAGWLGWRALRARQRPP